MDVNEAQRRGLGVERLAPPTFNRVATELKMKVSSIELNRRSADAKVLVIVRGIDQGADGVVDPVVLNGGAGGGGLGSTGAWGEYSAAMRDWVGWVVGVSDESKGYCNGGRRCVELGWRS